MYTRVHTDIKKKNYDCKYLYILAYLFHNWSKIRIFGWN